MSGTKNRWSAFVEPHDVEEVWSVVGVYGVTMILLLCSNRKRVRGCGLVNGPPTKRSLRKA